MRRRPSGPPFVLSTSLAAALSVAAVASGCGGSVDAGAFSGGDDAATDTAAGGDSTTGDTGPGTDSTPGADSGLPGDGSATDSGLPPDDTGSSDTGSPDTGSLDTGVPPPFDTGVLDTGGPPPDGGPTTEPCATLGKAYNGHCYYVLKPRTFAEQQAVCKSYGGYLVAITSDGEQAFVAGLYSSVENWIGLTREPTATGYTKWIDGESVGYTSWATGEPNFSGACVRMRPASDGSKWADQSCSTVINAICERDYL